MMKILQTLLLIVNMLFMLFGVWFGFYASRQIRAMEVLNTFNWQNINPEGYFLPDYQSVHVQWFAPVLIFGILQLGVTVGAMFTVRRAGMQWIGIITLILVLIHQAINVGLYIQNSRESIGLNVFFTEAVFLILIGLNLAALLQFAKQVVPPPVYPTAPSSPPVNRNTQNIRIG